jgi:hypothetical protein
VSEEFISYGEAVKVVRRPDDTDEQAGKRLLVAYLSGKVRHRNDEKRAAAWLDDERAKINARITKRIKILIARYKGPDMSDAEFEKVLREKALARLTSHAFVKFTQFELGSLLHWVTLTTEPRLTQLKQANPADILRAVQAVYADPKNNNPNQTDAEPLVKQWLVARGLKATRGQIRPVFNRKEFARRRTKAGYSKQH